MRYRVWGDGLPEINVEAESLEEALKKGQEVNKGYIGITPTGNTPQDRYNKKSMRKVAVKFHKEKDKEIIDMLESSEEGMAPLIKRLLREELERRKNS